MAKNSLQAHFTYFQPQTYVEIRRPLAVNPVPNWGKPVLG